MYWQTVDYGHGRAEARVPCSLLPNCERGCAQHDEGESDAAAARELFVEGQAREQYRNKDRELVDLHHDTYLPGGNGVVIEQPRCAGCNARCCEKYEFMSVNARDLP